MTSREEWLDWERLEPPLTGVDRVAEDVRAELEHHLACAGEELQAAGRTPEEARQEAEARFGDRAKIERNCRRILMGRTLLMQRLHRALTGVLLLAVGLLLWSQHVARARAQVSAQEALLELGQVRELLERSRAAALEPLEHIVIGVGDVLELIDPYNETLNVTRSVAADGQFLVPELGWVYLAGLTREEAEATLNQRLEDYFVETDVKVMVQQYEANPPGGD